MLYYFGGNRKNNQLWEYRNNVLLFAHEVFRLRQLKWQLASCAPGYERYFKIISVITFIKCQQSEEV